MENLEFRGEVLSSKTTKNITVKFPENRKLITINKKKEENNLKKVVILPP